MLTINLLSLVLTSSPNAEQTSHGKELKDLYMVLACPATNHGLQC